MTKKKEEVIKETLAFIVDLDGGGDEAIDSAKHAIKTVADELSYDLGSFEVESAFDAVKKSIVYRLVATGTK